MTKTLNIREYDIIEAKKIELAKLVGSDLSNLNRPDLYPINDEICEINNLIMRERIMKHFANYND